MMVIQGVNRTGLTTTARTDELAAAVNSDTVAAFFPGNDRALIEITAARGILASTQLIAQWLEADNHEINSVNDSLILQGNNAFIRNTNINAGPFLNVNVPNTTTIAFANTQQLEAFYNAVNVPLVNSGNASTIPEPFIMRFNIGTGNEFDIGVGPNHPFNGNNPRSVTPGLVRLFRVNNTTIAFLGATGTTRVPHTIPTNAPNATQTFAVGGSDRLIATAYTTAPESQVGLLQPRIYPADRCTWVQSVGADGRGYGVSNVMFYPGNAGAQSVNSAQLGFIGKSGRFVQIAD